MSDEILCEKCGAQMRPFDPLKPVGMTCDRCGWGWATSFVESIFSDTTRYSLVVSKNSTPNTNMLRVIARLCSCNYINAKEQIIAHDIVITDIATTIRGYAKMLYENNIPFEISPEFPYDYK